MAIIPIVLTNGTTADANDVMSIFDEIYSNIDSTNMDPAEVVGSGKIVLQTSPTFAGTVSFPTGLNIASTQRLYLDGGSDTYITEGAANRIDFYCNAINTLNVASTLFTSNIDLALAATKKVFLDGGSDTYLQEQSANQMVAIVGGSTGWSCTTTNFTLGSALDSIIASGKKAFLDGGGDTYLSEGAANRMDFYSGGTNTINITSSLFTSNIDLAVAATKKLFLDGGGNTYIYESSADVLDFYAGANNTLKLTPLEATVNGIFHATGDGLIDGSATISTNLHVTGTSNSSNYAAVGTNLSSSVNIGADVFFNSYTYSNIGSGDAGLFDVSASENNLLLFKLSAGQLNGAGLGGYQGKVLISVAGTHYYLPVYA